MQTFGSSHYLYIFALTLIYSQFPHPTTCSPNNLETQILELKIKAITSVELSSMSFDELPSLFFLYESFVTKRFESVHKKDRRKFEEFRKIHQYNAILNSYFDFHIRDVLINERFDVRNLDIISKKVNWTESDVTKYGLLSAVPAVTRKTLERDFDFHEEAFKNFFTAQYFYDNLVHPKDHPSDDELELRIRFFLHIIADDYEPKLLTNDFINGMIEDQKDAIFNDQVRMVMKYRFKYLLDQILPDLLYIVEKVTKVFSNDAEILGNLWGIDDNQPYFLRYFSFLYTNDKVCELKEVAEKFFIIGTESNLTSNSTKLQADNIFRGKNQILNVLYRIHEKKNQKFTKDILDVTKYQVGDDVLANLSQYKDFLDFVDASSYSAIEKRAFYLANAEYFINNAKNGSNLLTFWRRIQKYFNVNELKSILTAKDINFNYTHMFMLQRHNDQSYVETFLNLSQFYLSKDEINEMLVQKSPFGNESFISKDISIVNNVRIFELNYNFAKTHLDHEQLKVLLFHNDPVLFIYKVIRNPAIFRFCMTIMTEFYTDDDIRAMLMQTDKDSTKSTLFRAVGSTSSKKDRQDVKDYFKEMFKGHEDKLKELYRIRNSRGETVLGDFNKTYYPNEIKALLDLAEELFTKEEIDEIQKSQE
ncbi:hypothetical protein ACKWTF_014078 [Chironomus riparius]